VHEFVIQNLPPVSLTEINALMAIEGCGYYIRKTFV